MGGNLIREQMKAICQDAGAYAGLGDARKVGFGRFHVTDFNIIQKKHMPKKRTPYETWRKT